MVQSIIFLKKPYFSSFFNHLFYLNTQRPLFYQLPIFSHFTQQSDSLMEIVMVRSTLTTNDQQAVCQKYETSLSQYFQCEMSLKALATESTGMEISLTSPINLDQLIAFTANLCQLTTTSFAISSSNQKSISDVHSIWLTEPHLGYIPHAALASLPLLLRPYFLHLPNSPLQNPSLLTKQPPMYTESIIKLSQQLEDVLDTYSDEALSSCDIHPRSIQPDILTDKDLDLLRATLLPDAILDVIIPLWKKSAQSCLQWVEAAAHDLQDRMVNNGICNGSVLSKMNLCFAVQRACEGRICFEKNREDGSDSSSSSSSFTTTTTRSQKLIEDFDQQHIDLLKCWLSVSTNTPRIYSILRCLFTNVLHLERKAYENLILFSDSIYYPLLHVSLTERWLLSFTLFAGSILPYTSLLFPDDNDI